MVSISPKGWTDDTPEAQAPLVDRTHGNPRLGDHRDQCIGRAS
jgi:hypothetical protein